MPATVNMLDIEYDLEQSFVTALRAIFSYDDRFIYNQDQTQTGLIISSAFPEKDAEMRIPQIVVAITNFQMSQTSLFNNFHSDIIENGVVVGGRYSTPIPYSVSLICLANKDGVAKDLANKVLKYIIFTADEIFNDTLSLNITNVGKSSGNTQRQLPDKAFAHSVHLSGTLLWTGTKVVTEEERALLQKIKLEIIKN